MDNVNDVCYLVRLIVRQIFVFLRDLIVHEFPWFGTTADNLEVVESKIRGAAMSKHITADFVALFSVCGLLFLIVLLSAFGKEDSGFPLPTLEPAPMDLEHCDDRTYGLSESTNSMITSCLHACGDSICSRGTFHGRYAPPRGTNLSRTSETKIPSSLSQHSQSTQTTTRAFQKANGPKEWLIRRTRSGQVYGKYPM